MMSLDQKELGLYATALNNADLLVLARRIAREISQVHGSVVIDDVRQHPALEGRNPSSSNFWGAIWHELGWKCIGFEPSRVKRNHARFVRRWKWQPN